MPNYLLALGPGNSGTPPVVWFAVVPLLLLILPSTCTA